MANGVSYITLRGESDNDAPGAQLQAQTTKHEQTLFVMEKIVITGGAGNVSKKICSHLAGRFHIVLLDLNSQSLDQVCAELKAAVDKSADRLQTVSWHNRPNTHHLNLFKHKILTLLQPAQPR